MDNLIALISIIFIIVLLYYSIIRIIKSLLHSKRIYNKHNNRKSKKIPNYEKKYIQTKDTPFLHKIPNYELKGKADVSEFFTPAIGNKTINNKFHNAKFILSNKLDEIK